MYGFLSLLDITRYEIAQADEACFKYTGSKSIVQIKHVLTYLFFFVPQAIFVIMLYPINYIFFRWFTSPQFVRLSYEIVVAFADIFKFPIWLTVCYYRLRRGSHDEILLKMWKNPLVAYPAISDYRKLYN